MKNRHGFVSNSSSSSYIVLVKPDYVPTMEEIKKIDAFAEAFGDMEDDNYCSEEGELNDENILQKIIAMTQEFRDGNVIFEDDAEWHVAEDVVLELPGVLTVGGVGVGGGGGTIAGISATKFKELKEFLDA